MDGSADINQTTVHSLQIGFQLSGGRGLHGNTLLFEASSPTTSYVSEYAAFIIIHNLIIYLQLLRILFTT